MRFGLRLAGDGIVMESGRVLMTGRADAVLHNPQMADLYFGGSVKTDHEAAGRPPVEAS